MCEISRARQANRMTRIADDSGRDSFHHGVRMVLYHHHFCPAQTASLVCVPSFEASLDLFFELRRTHDEQEFEMIHQVPANCLAC